MKFAGIEAVIEASASDQILVVGYGNTLRRDDGAGVKLAERLAVAMGGMGRPVRLLTVPQLVPELAAEIAEESVAAVVFVDAEAGFPTRAISIRRIVGECASPSLGHHLEPGALLTIAARLYGRDVKGWLVTVPGVDFEHGECLSPTVQRLLFGASQIAERVCREIEAYAPCTN